MVKVKLRSGNSQGMSSEWRLVDLGPVDGYTMTNLYEAIALAVTKGTVPNTFVLNHPSKPFVNIGYHQMMEKEINIAYAEEMGFDLVRRTLGGGAILDGPWEQDYFFILNKYSDECPSAIPEFYNRFLQPPVSALKKLGLEAKIRQPNDILVNGKKISGNGAITIENTNVLAGDLLIDVPSKLMAKILNTPSEKFQDKLADTMDKWLTSINLELEMKIGRNKVKQKLRQSFEETLGHTLIPGSLSDEEIHTLKNLVNERKKKEWIFGKDIAHQSLLQKYKTRIAKIHSGVTVSEAVHKADKLIRITLVRREDIIDGISISGDFFTQPFLGAITEIEKSLYGAKLEGTILQNRVENTFKKLGINVYGFTQEDLVKTIIKAAG
jgi:lipoate-protein ligase A